jgi:hypothetical protein
MLASFSANTVFHLLLPPPSFVVPLHQLPLLVPDSDLSCWFD